MLIIFQKKQSLKLFSNKQTNLIYYPMVIMISLKCVKLRSTLQQQERLSKLQHGPSSILRRRRNGRQQQPELCSDRRVVFSDRRRTREYVKEDPAHQEDTHNFLEKCVQWLCTCPRHYAPTKKKLPRSEHESYGMPDRFEELRLREEVQMDLREWHVLSHWMLSEVAPWPLRGALALRGGCLHSGECLGFTR